jgi:hypothetical protein
MFSGVFMAAAGDLHPIVEVKSGFLLGATLDGKWVKAEEAAKSMQRDTAYRVYTLTEKLGETKGSEPKSASEPCPDTFEVSLSPKPERGVIAIAATWNTMPRKVRKADATQKAYIDAVRDFLRKRGIKEPKVKIAQILRVDLNGDGEDEVLISATNYFSNDDSVPSSAPSGSYSLVLLRRMVAGTLRTQLVAGEFYPSAANFNAPNSYDVSAVLDLDGDGKLEIVVHSGYYEGGVTTIYRCEPTKINAVLSVECGA